MAMGKLEIEYMIPTVTNSLAMSRLNFRIGLDRVVAMGMRSASIAGSEPEIPQCCHFGEITCSISQKNLQEFIEKHCQTR